MDIKEDSQELFKQVIKKYKRRKLYARFKDNIWAADLLEMGSFSSFNHGIKYLLCAIDLYTKYTLVKPLNDKKAKTARHVFIDILNESKHKPNKLWVDQGRQFHDKLLQK